MGIWHKMIAIQKETNDKNRIKREEKVAQRAVEKNTIDQFKKITKNKPVFQMQIKQDSSQYFTANEQHRYSYVIYQHEVGKVVIENLKEYDLLSYTWTPNIEGGKQFSAATALTAAAVIGGIGLLAGAKGQKGEDKSFATLLLKEIESGEVVKIVGDVKIAEAERLAGFISVEELGFYE